MGSSFTVDDLIALAPPPEWRVDAGSPGAWGRIEAELRTPLPEDYKLFINVYGTGIFNDLFFTFNPFAWNDGMNLLWQSGAPQCFEEDAEPGRVHRLGSRLEHHESRRAEFPDSTPTFPPYPEPGGLLPLGGDTNGGAAYWLTEGRPDDWHLILVHDDFDFERHPMPLVEFLVRWLSGDLPECFGGVGSAFLNATDPVFRTS
ncbi:hypothetical protein [Aquisphaera insulae]|uniref:hypothetical protein n=1 Tax=Aquisphaera insulae TaxID=2712864 RepID=UPI0013EA3E02|nr:hypothetical protein [Aquisphaera insulae]